MKAKRNPQVQAAIASIKKTIDYLDDLPGAGRWRDNTECEQLQALIRYIEELEGKAPKAHRKSLVSPPAPTSAIATASIRAQLRDVFNIDKKRLTRVLVTSDGTIMVNCTRQDGSGYLLARNIADAALKLNNPANDFGGAGR